MSMAPKTSKAAVVNPYESPQGVRDFFPIDMRRQNWLFNKWRAVAEKYGFEEYEAACLEAEEIFLRKKVAQFSAKLTDAQQDDLVKEMYTFMSDDQRVCLRPELTTSMARMVLSKQSKQTGNIELRLPLKWYSIPRCWRNETPQKGRKREFFQWNMDIVGVPSVFADAELLAALIDFFRSIGLRSSEVEIQLNSRTVILELLSKLKVDDTRYDEVVRIVDKRDKFPTLSAAQQELANIVGDEEATVILKLTDYRELEDFATAAGLKESPGVQELRGLFGLLAKAGNSDWVKFDASIARGLDYYTGVVFEAFAIDSSLDVRRAICGGGRYNRLLSVLAVEGSSAKEKEVPCIGFGLGDCVIFELLSALKRMPQDKDVFEPVCFAVVPFTEKEMGDAMQIAQQLRAAGKTVDVCLDPRVVRGKPNVKAAFTYANMRLAVAGGSGAAYIAFVAPEELEKGLVQVKDLRGKEGVEWAVPLTELADVENWVRRNPPLPCRKRGL